MWKQLALIALLAPMPAQAASGFLYDCTLTDADKSRGWISSKLAVVVPGDGTVQVVDGVILHFNGAPLAAEVLRDNGQRLILKWSIENARAKSGKSFANLDYRVSIAKSSGAIEMHTMPRNYDAGMRSGGTCVKRTR